MLGIRKGFTENDLYDNLAWLSERQSWMERELFSERYPDGSAPSLFLYDVTSSYLEGVENEFADWGYNRDKKKGKMQIVVGLLCDEKGMPVSVEVFEGNTSDPKTVGSQIEKAAKRFGCGRVTFVGDRGMLKSDPLEALASEGFSYITGITKAQISKLLREGHLQLGLFDDDLKEVRVGDVRYVFRRNPVRREETEEMRTGKRKSVEETVDRMNAYLSEHPKAKTETALKRVRAKIEKLKTGSWLSAEAEGPVVKLAVDGKALAEEEILDGCYVLKTDLPESTADKETVNARYKSLYHVERAFRSCKSLAGASPDTRAEEGEHPGARVRGDAGVHGPAGAREGVERSERDGGRGARASEDVPCVLEDEASGREGSAPYSGAGRNVFEAAGRAGRDVAGHRTCEFGPCAHVQESEERGLNLLGARPPMFLAHL